jgi:hypothetical protein
VGMASQPAAGGTGPLYKYSEAARRAAEEDVVMSRSDDAEKQEHLTGEERAALNRDVDPRA